MSTPKTNGNGAKEVTPATANKTTTQPTAEQLKAQAQKEQAQYFDGLTDLVYKRARFQEHKDAVSELSFEKAHEDIFEHTNQYGGMIVLKDFNQNSYEIKNPKLVIELRNYLLALFDGKITDLENGIFLYSEQKKATPAA
ncbi:MAG: hypothetical protein F9K23_18380 [Bacteroidetes bacterium]|nr:MAG: hypothetical protein F9K23_18380 [Bacteroidota bacterium]